MKRERFPQNILHLANSIIALNRQGEGDPRLIKRIDRLSDQLTRHSEEMKTRVDGYISSESRVVPGGGRNTSRRYKRRA